jgi:hypothetical protein
MNQARVVYHLARADFLERVRRYGFLVTLGLAVFLGYQAAIGNITLRLDEYRGEFNTAWAGAMMSLIATFFLGWFGFYVVKGSVNRDIETGVGQIMATTPLTRPVYTIGKWFSNFAVLMTMVLILAVFAVIIQFINGESAQLDVTGLLAPFFLVTTPVMALVAALAVLFETISFLQGGFGNVVYFFLFAFLAPLTDSQFIKDRPGLDPLGLSIFIESMGNAARATFPEYTSGFSLGIDFESATHVFTWTGVDWTPEIIYFRIAILLLSFGLTILAALFFTRFDPSRRRVRRTKIRASLPTPEGDSPSQSPYQPIHLTSLRGSKSHFAFFRVLKSELGLLLKGQRWWWHAVMLGLIVAGAVNTAQNARQFVLMLAWIWPILVWSGLGNRELQNNTQQMVFSSAAPLLRQLPAQWVAGFVITALAGSGVLIKLLSAGDAVGFLAWISAAVFIPSLALASGVVSGSHKVFEILYMCLWYIGPLNKVPPLDYLGANSDGNIGFFIPFSLALILVAFISRARQLQI